MALEFKYNKDADRQERGRRNEYQRDTERELGVRWGTFEAGYRAKTQTKKVDEERRDVKDKVERTFHLGFA